MKSMLGKLPLIFVVSSWTTRIGCGGCLWVHGAAVPSSSLLSPSTSSPRVREEKNGWIQQQQQQRRRRSKPVTRRRRGRWHWHDEHHHHDGAGNHDDTVLYSVSRRHRGRRHLLADDNTACWETQHLDDDKTITHVQEVNRVSMWPPWPLSLFKRIEEGSFGNQGAASSSTTGTIGTSQQKVPTTTTASNMYPSMGALLWAYLRQRARIGVRQAQEVGSQLWFHLPPASPPLLLFACWPRSKVVTVIQDGMSVEITRRVFPVLSNPMARTLALASLGMAVLSWSQQELDRKRQLTPLPFASLSGGGGVSRAILPPFLPEPVPEPEIQALQVAAAAEAAEKHIQGNEEEESSNNILSRVSPKVTKQLYEFYETASRPQRNVRYFYEKWKRRRDIRKREVAKIKRLTTFDELVALQALKRKANMAAGKRGKMVGGGGSSTSYALVTGASQGIGRAMAVELARWEIPLVLVARDVNKLMSLAYDLEACYGVTCCVLGADLSKMDAAENIHRATSEAGISVEILCNNAGIAYEGLSIDIATEDVERMVVLNCANFAKLSQLYGRDMKDRHRGRMLMVSSMAGLCSATPNTAVYGATKAFGKSLALSMGKELEPYGVGVTCLLPGAVKDTQFRASSGTHRALCWYLPFYARPAQSVAHQGVISMLDGDAQAIPGFQNRVFANLVRPIIPQRGEVMLVQAAFSPLRLPNLKNFFRGRDKSQKEAVPDTTSTPTTATQISALPPSSSSLTPLNLEPRYKMQPPPRILKLPDPTSSNKEEVGVHNVEKIVPPNENEVGSFPKVGNASQPIADAPNVSVEDPPRNVSEHGNKTGRIDVTDSSSSIESLEEESKEIPVIRSPTTGTTLEYPPKEMILDNAPLTSQEEAVCESQEATTLERPETQQKTEKRDETEDEEMEGVQRKLQRTNSNSFVPWSDDSDDEGSLSPRLGPVDIMEHRNFMLPRQRSTRLNREWTIIA